MYNQRRLIELLDLLVAHEIIHEGQKGDVLNRGYDQARHLMLDKREHLRRLMGRKRVIYELSEEELIDSFRFRRKDQPQDFVNEDVIFRLVAQNMGLPFVVLDPLQLDYRLVTDSFGGPFAERHLIIAIEDTPDTLTVATAKP
ncbi:MAG: hypothetical protein VX278_11415, partial [Myxococcota bacterium]|nr:hypothetical protein [Myxococcota bacterium]